MNNPLIWTSLLLLLAVVPTQPDTWEYKHSVRPGHGIGVLNLGWGPQKVRSTMWTARAVPMLTDKNGVARPYFDRQANAWVELYHADRIGSDRYATVFKVFYRDHKVVQLAVSGGAYTTNKGASTRLMSSEFQRRHPSLERQNLVESWGGRVRIYNSPPNGLAVTYVVFATGREAVGAQDIIVHPPYAPILVESQRHEGDIRPTDLDAVKRRMRPAPG